MLSGGARAVARCRELAVAPYSDSAGGLFRGYLTPAHRATLDRVAAWMAEAGMTATIDPAGNLVGRHEAETPGAPALVIGSHLDSVRDAGAYDGPLGVMLGIEAVAALQGRRLPFAIEVYGFGDEEGSRFPAAMLTSRAVAGTLDTDLATIADAQGVTLAEALGGIGKDIAGYRGAARAPGTTLAYLETHIEQGPLLEAAERAVGTVTGIAAQIRLSVGLTGMAGHAGTTTMPLRRDALAGAAEMILAIEGIARGDASDLVATVGRIEALPGAPNVIAGEARFSIDIRSGDAARRDRAAAAIDTALREIAGVRGLGIAIAHIHDLPASPCAPALMDLLDAATVAAGHPVCRLVSGAGHDAMVMAALAPTAMLFIRCHDGISHNPAEHVEPADAEVALAVMSGFIDRLGETRA